MVAAIFAFAAARDAPDDYREKHVFVVREKKALFSRCTGASCDTLEKA
jgi:hypothetical protein